jgi:thioredoxin
MPVKHVNSKAEFDEALKTDKLVIVDFFAEWCGPCKRIAPFLEAKSDELADSVVFVKVDVDEVSQVAEEQQISAMPTFYAFKNGSKVGDLVGASQDGLIALIEKHK